MVLPAQLMTLPGLLAHHRAHRAAVIAFAEADGSYALTYAALERNAYKIARGIASVGAEPGDRIAYLGKNGVGYFELLCGASLVGVAVVPIGWRLSIDEVGEILADAKPTLLFIEGGLRALAGRFAAPVVEIGEGGDSLRAWRDRFDPADGLPIEDDADRVIVQLYTSGTTGRPKGVMLSHANLLLQREIARHDVASWDKWNGEDVSLISMPIAHISGTGWAMYGLHAGATAVVVREFDPPAVLRTIRDHRVTRLFIVPTALRMLANQANATATHPASLRCICYGGSPIDVATLDAALTAFSCDLVQLYGMTECAGAASALGPNEHRSGDARLLASAGRPLAGVEITILDADGAASPVGQAGEIAIRFSGVTRGYFNLAQATAEAVTPEGWLRTGDVGEFDPQGYLHIRDRLKDMIISGGENVYAAEVESVFAKHPHIVEIAVIGTPDPRWGEMVTAVVVCSPGSTLDVEDLAVWGRGRIAGYKLPRALILREELPRNAAGKIMKRYLRAELGGA